MIKSHFTRSNDTVAGFKCYHLFSFYKREHYTPATVTKILLPHDAIVIEPAFALRNVAEHIFIKVCEKLSATELRPRIRLVVFGLQLFQIFLRCAKLLRWDIPLHAAHLATVLLGALPDGIQLLLLQRRYTLGRFYIEVRLRFRLTVTLNELACLLVQGTITSAC